MVVTQMRTSSDQVLVISEKAETAYLETKLDPVKEISPESILETSLVRETLLNGRSVDR